MTKQEFITKQRKLTDSTNKRLGLWMIFFFAALLSCIPITRYIERHEQNYRWMVAVVGIGLFVFLFGNLVMMAWYNFKQQRRFGYRCPHCDKELTGFLAQIAIATSNCGHCGESVFSEHATL